MDMSSYKILDEPLKLINQKYISITKEEEKHNNEKLVMITYLIGIIKENNALFKKLFERLHFVGSYYENLKVGKPNKFDLDLVLVLPKMCETHNSKYCECLEVGPSDKPGWFWFQMQKGYCTAMDKFIKNGYVQTNLMLDWFKSNLVIALNQLKYHDDINNYSVKDRPVYHSESEPAFTLRLDGDFGEIKVDLVLAFKFGPDHWPQHEYRPNKTSKTDFFIVPKKNETADQSESYWLLSFQDQERELIKGKERLKPALRLLKKMRTNLVHKISSYALKTIVLWEVNTNNHNWSTESLGEVFMKFLERYVDCLNNERIPYYWNRQNNLLDGINPVTLENHHNEISKLLKRVKDNYLHDPCIIAKVILKEGTEEYKKFFDEYMEDPDEYVDDADSSVSLPQTEEVPWGAIAGAILGIGAVTAIGIGVVSALNNNRNRDRQ